MVISKINELKLLTVFALFMLSSITFAQTIRCKKITTADALYNTDESPGGGNIHGMSLNDVLEHNKQNPWNPIQTHVSHQFWQAEVKDPYEGWKVWRAHDDTIPSSDYEWGSKSNCLDGTRDYFNGGR